MNERIIKLGTPEWRPCDTCGGNGFLPSQEGPKPCRTCYARGTITGPKTDERARFAQRQQQHVLPKWLLAEYADKTGHLHLWNTETDAVWKSRPEKSFRRRREYQVTEGEGSDMVLRFDAEQHLSQFEERLASVTRVIKPGVTELARRGTTKIPLVAGGRIMMEQLACNLILRQPNAFRTEERERRTALLSQLEEDGEPFAEAQASTLAGVERLLSVLDGTYQADTTLRCAVFGFAIATGTEQLVAGGANIAVIGSGEDFSVFLGLGKDFAAVWEHRPAGTVWNPGEDPRGTFTEAHIVRLKRMHVDAFNRSIVQGGGTIAASSSRTIERLRKTRARRRRRAARGLS